MSTNLKIARAYTVLVGASVLGHALSMVKEILGASLFGVSRAMDSFYAALTVPNLVNSVFLSPFAIIFIPILVKYRNKDMAEANRIISSVSNLIFIALGGASLVSLLFAGPIVSLTSPGLDGDTAANAAKMLRILSAGILFTGAVNILSGAINAFEHFLRPAISAMFITLCTIFLMLFFTDRLGVFVLGWGLVAGTVLQFLFLARFSGRLGLRYSPELDLRHPEIQKSFNLLALFMIISVIWGLNTVVTRFMASWLPAGSIAALAYADKLVQVPLIIFSGAIATSIYPFLAAQAAENRTEDIRNTISLALRMSGFIFIPLAITMMILARPAIQLLFQRGAFDAAATDLTSAILVSYSFLLFSNYAVAILARLLFAFQDLRSVIKVALVTLAVNIGLNFLLMRLMDPPAAGIALASAASSMLSAVLYFLILKKRVASLHGAEILRSLSRITAFSLLTGAAVFYAFKGLSGIFHATLLDQSIALAGATLAGMACFLSISAFFKLEEFRKVYQLVLNRLRPGQGQAA